jgi:hypothetical protein
VGVGCSATNTERQGTTIDEQGLSDQDDPRNVDLSGGGRADGEPRLVVAVDEFRITIVQSAQAR